MNAIDSHPGQVEFFLSSFFARTDFKRDAWRMLDARREKSADERKNKLLHSVVT